MTKQFLLISFVFILNSCDETINGSTNNDTNCPVFTITSVNNGDASSNNFNVSFNNETNIVLGFSMSADTIPAGCGTLIEFSSNNGTPENLNDIVFSDDGGNAVNIAFASGEYTHGCYLPMNTVSIYNNKVIYNSNTILSGFQFKIVGSNVVMCLDGSTACTYEECPVTDYFNLDIDETGVSTLLIFQNTINTLDIGDEIGIYDSNGIVDNAGNSGDVLVGYGIWNNSQLNIVAIMCLDLSSSGGPILPGAVSSNNVVIKIWKTYSQTLAEDIDVIIDTGSGTFNELFTAYSGLTIQE